MKKIIKNIIKFVKTISLIILKFKIISTENCLELKELTNEEETKCLSCMDPLFHASQSLNTSLCEEIIFIVYIRSESQTYTNGFRGSKMYIYLFIYFVGFFLSSISTFGSLFVASLFPYICRWNSFSFCSVDSLFFFSFSYFFFLFIELEFWLLMLPLLLSTCVVL